MAARAQIVFAKSSDLAVIGDDGSFWLCRAMESVRDTSGAFRIQWYEKQGQEYVLCGSTQTISLKCVIDSVELVKGSKPKHFELSSKSEKTVTSAFQKFNAKKSKSGKKRGEEVRAQQLKFDDPSVNSKATIKDTGKRKAKDELELGTPHKRSKVKSVEEKCSKKKNDNPNDPNRRLKPNLEIKVMAKDPFFDDCSSAFPRVSSTADSRILFAAIKKKNYKFLDQCRRDVKRLHCIDIRKSLADNITPLQYALLHHDLEAMRILCKQDQVSKKPRVEKPRCYIKQSDTGTYNYLSLNIKKIRRVNPSRGGKEGNNALTKDMDSVTSDTGTHWRQGPNGSVSNNHVACLAMKWGVPYKITQEMAGNLKVCDKQDFYLAAIHAVRHGHQELAARYMDPSWDPEYNHYHSESLMPYHKVQKKWSELPLREASAKKKAHFGLTPLHCAAINPDTRALQHLFKVCPDLYVQDDQGRKLVHYAAACRTTAPLKFLLEKGANLNDTDSEGATPLHVACRVATDATYHSGNVTFLLDECKNPDADEVTVKRFGLSNVDKPQSNSFCPLHHAVVARNRRIVEILIDFGVAVDKPLNAFYNKLTPLMMAAALGDLPMVQLLVEKGYAKIEKPDRHKKTALTHAVMNGSTSVASYLIAKGASTSKPDSSENTILHYACAYGWFACMQLVVKAGAPLNHANVWGLTPIAAAALKGHDGIFKHLLNMDGVDVNVRDDKGRSILLTMVIESDLSSRALAEIEDLIEHRGADPKMCDFEGKNALHHLASRKLSIYDPGNADSVAHLKDQLEAQLRGVRLFLRHGCSPFDIDKFGTMPVEVAMGNCHNLTIFVVQLLEQGETAGNCSTDGLHVATKSYSVIHDLLDAMMTQRNKMLSPGLLNSFAININFFQIEEEASTLEKIAMTVSNCLTARSKEQLSSLVEHRSPHSKLTPVINMCRQYAKFPRNEFDFEPTKNSLPYFTLAGMSIQNGLLEKYEARYQTARDVIKYFIQHFKPTLHQTFEVEFKGGIKKTANTSALLEIVSAKDKEQGFNVIWELDPNPIQSINLTDENGLNGLMKAVKRGDFDQAVFLISKGAEVNAVFKEQDPTNKDATRPTTVVIQAIKGGSLQVVRGLLKTGKLDMAQTNVHEFRKHHVCSVKPMGLVKHAVIHSSKHRDNRKRLAILELLIGAFKEANIFSMDEVFGDSLHQSLLSIKDPNNQSLDLELALLRSGVNIGHLDACSRTALHCVFGLTGDSRDPVEMCSILVNDKTDRAIIKAKDQFGATALHHAAATGATVCCLLLLKTGHADLDAEDEFGHTPLANAVKHKQESTSLMLLQKGAVLEGYIDPNATYNLALATKQEKNGNGKFKYLPQHFTIADKEEKYTIFEGIVRNSWLGLTYLALEKLTSIDQTMAIETAFRVDRLQFAKTLITRQVNMSDLNQIGEEGRNLLISLAFYLKTTKQELEPLVEDIFGFLVNKVGLDISLGDRYGCTALHYACLNANLALVKLVCLSGTKDFGKMLNSQDSLGRTPLAAALWNYSERPHQTTREVVSYLLENGEHANRFIRLQPISHIQRGYVMKKSYLCKDVETFSGTPLTMAAAFGDLKMAELLLRRGATQLPDENGILPLSHALLSSSKELAKMLLQQDDSSSLNPDVVRHSIQFNDSALGKGAFVTTDMFDFVCENIQQGHVVFPKSAIQEIARAGALKSAAKLAKLSGWKSWKSCIVDEFEVQKWPDDFHVTDSHYDTTKDAQAMLRQLEEQQNQGSIDTFAHDHEGSTILQLITQATKSQIDCASDADSYSSGTACAYVVEPSYSPKACQVSEGELFEGHQITMTKIDVSAGPYGMYNFYRMELWKEKQQDVWVLFTNWGRIGDWRGGQFQNTPFKSGEEAKAEFAKIFKAKSGNEWHNLPSFTNVPKKYRLVKAQHLRPVKRGEAIKIELDDKTSKSKLDVETRGLLADLADCAMYEKEYKTIGQDYDAVPFGRICRSEVEEAGRILENLDQLVKEKEKAEMEKALPKAGVQQEDKYCQLIRQIFDLSSEYYHLMPQKGYSVLKVKPLDNKWEIQKQKLRVLHVLEFEVAERLLLGARFRQLEVNPLDYIHSALGAKIRPLDPGSSQEDLLASNSILHYIYNSAEKDIAVESIFAVSLKADKDKEAWCRDNLRDLDNKWLLWHGTKTVNLLGILKDGLLVDAPYAEITGRAYGSGIYLADTFGKSINYSSDGSNRRLGKKRNMTCQYILLCETWLGKCRVVNEDSYHTYDPEARDNVTNSVHVLGQKLPEPGFNVRLQTMGSNVTLPLGKLHENSKGVHMFSEYCVYNKNQVTLRYIIKLKNEN